MQKLIFGALSGGLFGAGLVLSGMTDTTRVQGWLDVFGDWDPTLAFVMGGALTAWAAWAHRGGAVAACVAVLAVIGWAGAPRGPRV